MAVIEVDETQFLNASNVVKTVQAIMADPEARNQLLRAQKKVMPNVSIPEIDAVDEGMSELQKLRAEIEEDRKQRATEKAEADAAANMKSFAKSWEKNKTRLRVEQGYTQEGIDAIERLAHDRGIVDLEAAAALFDKLNPAPEPISGPGLGGWNMFESASAESNDYIAKLIASEGENESAIRQEIASALAEVRGGRRA